MGAASDDIVVVRLQNIPMEAVSKDTGQLNCWDNNNSRRYCRGYQYGRGMYQGTIETAKIWESGDSGNGETGRKIRQIVLPVA